MATKVKKDQEECMKTRTVLWFLVFTGFAVNYMIRINLNIGIVSMVKTAPKSNESLTSECIIDNPVENKTHGILLARYMENGNSSKDENNRTTTVKKIHDESEGFEWSEYDQGLILGAFFWIHWTTQIPGGLLANKYGTKIVFGLSNFAGVLFCFIIPTASYMGFEYLILVRCLQGLVAGFSWPAMHTLTARWIPPNERSKFVTAYLGSSVGAALTFPMCGYIIDIWGWQLVFYVSGVLGTMWYVAWYFLVFDSPADHPRISQSEREYIENSLGQSFSKEKAPVPWKDLLTSVPVWMNVLAQWGGIWGLFTLMTHAPTYFKKIHGWDIKTTGMLSGMPHILRMVFAYLFSILGDHLLTTNKMSRTNVRKLATAICCIGQGFCMLALAYSGCNYTMAIIFLTAATAIHGAVSTGPLASLVDLSPNYASVSLGACNTIAVVVGFLSPLITGLLIDQNQTVGQWQKVFWIAAAMLIVTGGLYVAFAKSELQSWNSPGSSKSKDAVLESELVTLKKKDKEEEEFESKEQEKSSVIAVNEKEKENY